MESRRLSRLVINDLQMDHQFRMRLRLKRQMQKLEQFLSAILVMKFLAKSKELKKLREFEASCVIHMKVIRELSKQDS